MTQNSRYFVTHVYVLWVPYPAFCKTKTVVCAWPKQWSGLCHDQNNGLVYVMTGLWNVVMVCKIFVTGLSNLLFWFLNEISFWICVNLFVKFVASRVSEKFCSWRLDTGAKRSSYPSITGRHSVTWRKWHTRPDNFARRTEEGQQRFQWQRRN